MSFKIKQRFSELLAIVLIVAMVGFLVYMLIPSNSKPPKSSPVTVRSTASVEEQQKHAATKLPNQTPQSSQVLQKSTVASDTTPQPTQHAAASVENQGNHNGLQNVKPSVQQPTNKTSNIIASANAKVTCTAGPKPVTKLGSALRTLPIVGELVTDLTNCSS